MTPHPDVPQQVRLDEFDHTRHDPGAALPKRLLWYLANALVMDGWLFPSSTLKVALLRMFGATVGAGVVVKPRVNIKYPWKLEVGDHAWIGEGAWIDNIAPVRLGSHVCISQSAYLCTGNHDWSDPRFALTALPIVIGDQAWVGARATVAPGVTLGEGCVLTAGSVAARSKAPWTICAGNPAAVVRHRQLRATRGDSGDARRAAMHDAEGAAP